jgi:hypothetical protein
MGGVAVVGLSCGFAAFARRRGRQPGNGLPVRPVAPIISEQFNRVWRADTPVATAEIIGWA